MLIRDLVIYCLAGLLGMGCAALALWLYRALRVRKPDRL